ncbi:MAG: fibrobacter succinogenes major paralogous domain-containing protein [Bacteroidia bacterium]
MKNLLILISFYCIAFTALAQAPQKFSYQAVIRNAGNQLVANQFVGIKISILQGTITGSAVYTETHNLLTNANGLATLEIGGGTLLSGNFSNINWANGPYFIKTETDVNGGANYTINATHQLLSVPYALYSNNVTSSVSNAGDTLFIGSSHYIIPGISAANNGGGGQTAYGSHSCGADSVHNANLTYGSMTDQDGNVYKTIIIGSQEWMAENLKTAHYRNGNAIPVVTSNTTWANLSSGASCWHNNDSAAYNCPYGKLYNWYAVTDSRQLCPTGWHVPSDAEYNTLVGFLDSGADLNCISCIQSSSAGAKMKSAGNTYWLAPNVDASNISGFAALGMPTRDTNGSFGILGIGTGLWTTTPANSFNSYFRLLLYSSGNILKDATGKDDGLSVRCLRD